MNLIGKKLLIRNKEESRKAQYLLFLFGYCWWSMRSSRGWRYNHIDGPAYIYLTDQEKKLVMYQDDITISSLPDKEEITVDQIIKCKLIY